MGLLKWSGAITYSGVLHANGEVDEMHCSSVPGCVMRKA